MLNIRRGNMYSTASFALLWLITSLLSTVAAMLIFKGHKLIIRHTSLHDLLCFVKEAAFKFVVMFVVMLIKNRHVYVGVTFALFADFLFTISLLVFVPLATSMTKSAKRFATSSIGSPSAITPALKSIQFGLLLYKFELVDIFIVGT